MVRNNRLSIMQEAGVTVNYEILNDADYANALKNKMLEETQELLDAGNIEKLKLVDVIEVIEHFVSFYGFNNEELEKIKAQKQEKRGAFDKRIKTNYVEMPDNHPDVAYYLSKPFKYPEIL